MHTENKTKVTIISIVVLIAILFVFGLVWAKLGGGRLVPEQVACTMDAKICPDGTAVGRTGPMCEFAPCPTVSNEVGLKTFSDPEQGISFKYPEDLGTTYIHPVNWPPKVTVSSKLFTCTESGTEIARAGQTQSKIIDDRTYCITKETEGAAGSIYTQYTYVAPVDDEIDGYVTFSLRTVQCDNYDEPQRSACKSEQMTYSVDNLAGGIVQSIKPIINYQP